ncbi:hypothetical protein SCH4B_2441 [Ruegeria sp. TrichCH4B]|nr:hypothetical protein SCH4B_2441 [Ruegeria sp. TrichCH4B]
MRSQMRPYFAGPLGAAPVGSGVHHAKGRAQPSKTTAGGA